MRFRNFTNSNFNSNFQMNLTEQINNDIKVAMKERNKVKLEALRSIKSALLLAATEKAGAGSSEEAELKMLQKQVKQRKEAAEIYISQGRQELADEELSQASIIEAYLPEQMSEDMLRSEIQKIIAEIGASSPADMGKVMGVASKSLSGKAEGKEISRLVKELLSK